MTYLCTRHLLTHPPREISTGREGVLTSSLKAPQGRVDDSRDSTTPTKLIGSPGASCLIQRRRRCDCKFVQELADPIEQHRLGQQHPSWWSEQEYPWQQQEHPTSGLHWRCGQSRHMCSFLSILSKVLSWSQTMKH